MAILQLGRFGLLTRLLGLRAPCHCVKEANVRLQADTKNARSVAMFRLRWLAARAATSDRVSVNAMAVCAVSN